MNSYLYGKLRLFAYHCHFKELTIVGILQQLKHMVLVLPKPNQHVDPQLLLVFFQKIMCNAYFKNIYCEF